MGWIASLFVAILTAIATLFGAGTVASLVVDWYNISSFEGGSGFFVIGMALLGGMAGFVIGLVVSRVIAALPRPTFIKALGGSVAAAAIILSVIAGGAYVFADIAPTIDGEELLLLTEIRWPASGQVAPASLGGVPYLRLGALQGRTVRRLEDGLVFVEDARLEDGRWIVPGVVPVFTRRGGRLVEFGTEGKTLAAFDVPLPRYPGKPQQQWSEWLPRARPGEPPLPDQFSYRYKVVRTSEALRTEVIGPFEVDTVASYFYYVGDGLRLAANATFRIRHKGQPIAGIPEVQFVATVASTRPALFVVDEHATDGTPCAVIAEFDDVAKVQRISGCATPVTVHLLTSDQALFEAATSNSSLPGWIDRVSFARPGLFQIDAAILDTRDLKASTFVFPESVRPDTGVPPLDLSPDESSFAWLVQGYDEQPRLGVTNWRTGDSYVLPIDRRRMRFNTASALDPRWVQHHFQWTRGSKGGDVLSERPDFVVLPYRGDLEPGKPGEYQGYTLRPGGEPLRNAIVELLVRDLGGERLPEDPGAFQQQVKVNGKTISVSVIGSPGSPSYVSVSMDAPEGDPAAMAVIAARLNAALASGKYDALFVSTADPK